MVNHDVYCKSECASILTGLRRVMNHLLTYLNVLNTSDERSCRCKP